MCVCVPAFISGLHPHCMHIETVHAIYTWRQLLFGFHSPVMLKTNLKTNCGVYCIILNDYSIVDACMCIPPASVHINRLACTY